MKKPVVWSITEADLRISRLIHLLPQVDVVTLNRMDGEKILKRRLHDYADIQAAAEVMVALGAKNVLLKGGHVEDLLFSQDHWTNGQESFWIASQRSSNKHFHGIGSMLSARISLYLAQGYSIEDAIVIAKMHINREIRLSMDRDQHTAPLVHSDWPENQIDLPYLSPTPFVKLPLPFKACTTGLYPIVDNSQWLEKLLPLGVKCIQLRIKDSQASQLEKEIKYSVLLAKKYKATLFINDHWELAIRFGADGIHLGQEDLYAADLNAIHQSGLYLGISTHCYYEVARAHAINPSYIACGPIYPTTSKTMSFNPQGIEQLQSWRRTLNYPLVAIGGINLERLPSILATGVEGIALISAITKAADPEYQTKQFLKRMGSIDHCFTPLSECKHV